MTSLKQIIFETFRLSWELVRDEASRRLFQLACYFPEATPVPLWLPGLASGLSEDARSFEPLGEACLHLREVSLFEELQGEQVRLHPLVREFGLMLLKEGQDARHTEYTEHMLTTQGIERLTATFIDLNMLQQRTEQLGYLTCLEQVRAAREYASILQADNTSVLERIERWLDRESYLFTDEASRIRQLPDVFYQQLFNHTVEEGKALFTGKAPAHWLEQLNRVGAEDTTLIRILVGHSDWVNSGAFSPDGTHILTGSDDTTARLWDSHSGHLLHSFEGHSGSVESVAFSPDGQYIVTSDNRGQVLLWRAQGPDRGRLLGMYVAVYEVGATFWHDATHLALVDKGGSTGHPFVYQLRLHGMKK